MSDVLACFFVTIALLLVVAVVIRRLDGWERRWAWFGLLAHAATALVHVMVVQNVYGGDIMGYYRFGVLIAGMLRESPLEVSWLLLQEVFHQDTALFPPNTLRGTTGAMYAISTFVVFLSNDSLWAACIIVSGFSYFGRLALYRVFRSELAPAQLRSALLGCLCVPSVMFWSSGLVKEAIATAGLGFTVFGGYTLATRRGLVQGLAPLALGVCAVAVVKPYLLLPAGIAVGLWFFFDGHRPRESRRTRTVRPGSAVAGITLAVVVLVGVGRIFPQFEAGSLAEQAATMQGLVEVTHGGSDYDLGGPRATTFSGQLTVVPLALVTVLVRPIPTDVTNPQIAVAAAETLATTLLLLWLLLRVGPRAIASRMRANPVLLFSAALAFGTAVGVGLATTNLGSLSRYRTPMVPFYVVTLVGLAWKPRAVAAPPGVARLRAFRGNA